MVSDFRRKKLLFVFSTFLDTDKSGSVTKEDFEQAAKKIADLKGWADGDPDYEKVKESNQKVWELLQEEADGDGDGVITQDEWITMWDTIIKKQGSELSEWQTENCKQMFKFIDSGNDDAIDEEEFVASYSHYGVSKEDASEAFKKAASGKDSLTLEDFQELWKQFFVSEDPEEPGNYICPIN